MDTYFFFRFLTKMEGGGGSANYFKSIDSNEKTVANILKANHFIG